MENLAIKEFKTRGKEVIEILEMLGGRNKYNLTGNDDCIYYVLENGEIRFGEYIFGNEPYNFFTLEEFLEKYPYKVGDRILLPICGKGIIESMYWDNEVSSIRYKIKGIYDSYFDASELQYESIEKSIDKTNEVIYGTQSQCCDIRKEIMDKEQFKQSLKDKLKYCDKDTLIDIIAEVCTIYVQARVFSNISNANCVQQCVNNIQTNTQEIDNFLTQRINKELANINIF